MESIKKEDILRTVQILSSMLTGPSGIDFRTNEEFYTGLSDDYLDPCFRGTELIPSPMSNGEDNFSYLSDLDISNNFFWIGNDSDSSSGFSSDCDLSPDPPSPPHPSFFPHGDQIFHSPVSPLPSISEPDSPSPRKATQPRCETNTRNGVQKHLDVSIYKKKQKRRRRKNLLKPGSQLYQFILQLLDDEDKRDHITWVKHKEGIFRIIKKEEVAKMWGNFKKRTMTYDSLSRGLRHYYQQGLLNSVNKKLHYQFTKKALDEWEEIRDKESIDEAR